MSKALGMVLGAVLLVAGAFLFLVGEFRFHNGAGIYQDTLLTEADFASHLCLASEGTTLKAEVTLHESEDAVALVIVPDQAWNQLQQDSGGFQEQLKSLVGSALVECMPGTAGEGVGLHWQAAAMGTYRVVLIPWLDGSNGGIGDGIPYTLSISCLGGVSSAFSTVGLVTFATGLISMTSTLIKGKARGRSHDVELVGRGQLVRPNSPFSK